MRNRLNSDAGDAFLLSSNYINIGNRFREGVDRAGAISDNLNLASSCKSGEQICLSGLAAGCRYIDGPSRGI